MSSASSAASGLARNRSWSVQSLCGRHRAPYNALRQIKNKDRRYWRVQLCFFAAFARWSLCDCPFVELLFVIARTVNVETRRRSGKAHESAKGSEFVFIEISRIDAFLSKFLVSVACLGIGRVMHLGSVLPNLVRRLCLAHCSKQTTNCFPLS